MSIWVEEGVPRWEAGIGECLAWRVGAEIGGWHWCVFG